MKKLFLLLFAALLFWGITTACGDKKDGADAEKTEQAEGEEAKTEAAGGNEVDALLDEYQQFYDEIAALQEKAKAGDADALKAAGEIMTKIQAWSTKAMELSSKMTPEQIQRMNELAQKMNELNKPQ